MTSGNALQILKVERKGLQSSLSDSTPEKVRLYITGRIFSLTFAINTLESNATIYQWEG